MSKIEWIETLNKAHTLDVWRSRSVKGEWPLIQYAANKLLEMGVKREIVLAEERTRVRRQNLKQKVLKERREEEELKLKLKLKEFGLLDE
jgi:hypothetical protein